MLKVLTRQIIDFYTTSITPQPDGRRARQFPRLDAGAAVTRDAAAVDEQAVAMRLLAGKPVTPVEDIAARVRPMAEAVAMSLWSYLASAMQKAESEGRGQGLPGIARHVIGCQFT